MEIKSKIKSTIFLIISFIILIGTIFYRVKAATKATTVVKLINDIKDWRTSISYSVGTVINEEGIENNDEKSIYWLCYSHKTVSNLKGSQKIRATLEINTRKLGTYISRAMRDGKYENSGVKSYANSTDEFKKVVRELNYLIFAATQDPSKRYVGDTYSSPSKNALYYYVNTATKSKMKTLIGDVVSKRTSSYTKEAESKGSNILKLASKYAEAEEDALKNKSSADITDSEDAGATVKVATADNGTTYSYIGPFYIKTAGTVTDVILKEGSKEHAIAGYSSKVGQNPKSTNAKNIPKNGNTFYILTEETAIEADSVKVTIKTEGTTGGVEFEYYKSEDGNRKKVKAKGYIKSRIAFLGNKSGQGTAVFSGQLVATTDDKDSVKLVASNTETPPGRLVLKKVGLFVGEGVNAEEYENLVEDFGFQIYRLDGSTKKYLRIEDQDTIKEDSIVIDETTSYDASESQATTLYTPASGKIVIEGLNTEYEYYIVEADNSKTDYKSEAYRWSYRHYQNGNQMVSREVVYGNENGNVFGPITITYNGVPDEITRLTIRNYRKTGDLLVKKVDVNNTDKKLGNVEFILLNIDEGKYVKAEKVGDGQYKVTDPATGYVKQESDATTFVTNSSTGELLITGLDVGEYQIIETKNPNYGYIAEGVSEVVVVKDSATEEVVMGNESYLSDLKIQKQDADDSSIKMSGVEFRLKRETSSDILGTGYVIAQQKDSSGNLKNLKTVTGSISCDGVAVTNNPDEATIFITDANGEIVVRNMISGVYTLEELSAGDSYGYLVNEDSVTWEIINYEIDAGIVDDDIIGGDDSGDTDQDTDMDSSLIEPEGIVGGKSVIIDLSGTAITAKDGTEQIKTVIVRNQKQTGNLKIQKQDADSAEAMAGVSFKIKRETSNDTLGSGYIIAMQKDSSGNLKAVSTVTGNIHLDGMEVTNNADQATTFITDENGKIGVYNLLVGTYTVEEISVGDRYGYYVNGDYVTWEVSNGTSTTTAQGISATIEVPRQPISETSENAVGTGTGTDVTVKNEKQTGNLKIQKQDADNAEDKMDNISFKIKRETSDENLGSGYVIAMQKDSSGNLKAVSTVTGNIHLDGMEVTNNADQATTFITDENGKIGVYNLLVGTYTVEEISVGDRYGYYVNDDYVTWEISSNGGVSATAQGTTATMDIPRQPSTQTSESAVGTGTGTDVTVKNEKQTGNLKIEKQDADNAEDKMDNISFKIKRETSDENLGSGYVIAMQKDGSGNLSALDTVTGSIHLDGMDVTNDPDNATTFVTDSNGKVEVYNILKGRYTVEEVSVGGKYGYYVNDDYVTWEISSNGGVSATAQGTTATMDIPRQPSTQTSESAVGTGTGTDVIVKNEKQTGNLRIEKRDADNDDDKMDNISFRIRRNESDENLGAGYVIAMQEDSSGNLQALDTVTGSIHLDGMQVTNNPEEATTFITDERGIIEVYNILRGSYTVEEISVGDRYGYYVAGEYIEWAVLTSEGGGAWTGNTTHIDLGIQRQPSTETSESALGTGEADIIHVKNEKQTGNLKIQKKDADNDSMKLKGISFRLRRLTSNAALGSGYVIAMDGNTASSATAVATATGTIYLDNMTVTQNANDATTFVTDENGIIEIYNILLGEYVIEEISVGDNFGYDIDSNFISWEITNSGGATSTVNNSTSATVEVVRQSSIETRPEVETQGSNSADNVTTNNTRKYIKIRGYAWEDMIDGKGSTRDYVWGDNGVDKRLQYVTVRLVSNGTVLDTAITDENGEYVFGNYDENPNAIKIEIDDLVGAYVEFEYNGMSYQSIVVDSNFNRVEETDSNGNTVVRYEHNTNKASEGDRRTEFNNRFATISKGISSNSNGEKTHDIRYNYDSENHESKVIFGDDLKYGYDGQKYPISGVYSQYTITARTAESRTNALCTNLTPEDIRRESTVEIGGLNLGVEEREMPDLYVLEDIQDVVISLNEYKHTYEYANRFKDYADYLPTEEGRKYLDTSVRFANKYIDGSYSREVYESDISYNSEHADGLQIKVTYVVKVTNEASTLSTRLNTLVNYFDGKYLDNVVIAIGDRKNVTNLSFGQLQTDNIGMKRIDIPVNDTIPAGQTRDYYITYTLSNEAINSIINGKLTLESVSEVGSYSSFDETGVYGGIDIDSAPDTVQRESYLVQEDNLEYNRIKISDGTLEDDVDKAPSLILSPKNGRNIEGTVWEDSAIADKLNPEGDTARERIGDGEYNASEENVVRQVRVELITYDGNNNEIPATLYQWDQSKTEHMVVDLNNVEVYTDSEGKYKFEGIIPGKYYLRYTYGNNSVIVDPNGNSVANVKPEDYKSTIYRKGQSDTIQNEYWYKDEISSISLERWSDAKDTDDIIDYRISENTTSEITYSTIINESGEYADGISAETANFEFGVEYEVGEVDNRTVYTTKEDGGFIEDNADGGLEFTIDNIDFGIIERPKQYLLVSKKIKHIQITLANGSDLVNGNPETDTLQGVRLLDNGEVYIEIDNEIIQGATLRITYEITVSNKECELDFNTRDYYIYGKYSNEDVPAIAKVKDMYDYLPEGMVLEENEYWEKIEITEDNKNTILAEKVYDKVSQNQNVVHLKGEGYRIYNSMGIPSEASTEMILSTQLTSTAKDMTYENDVEIVKLENRKTTDATPGNYDPTENQSYMGDRVPTPLNIPDDGSSTIHPTSTPGPNSPNAPEEPIVIDEWGPTEPDDADAPLVITPPTGSDENTSYWTYGIIGISVLIVLGLGVVIIKKKIL